MNRAKGVTGEEPSVIDGDLTPGAVIADKYVIEHLLGEGGMGAVWSAYHLQTNRPVAIKALRDFGGEAATERARQRLLREARAAGSIRHPNVVDVYDVIETTEGPLLVMERLEGEPLQALMGRGLLTPADALRVLMPAMRGVAAAHERGVVHRDLKPDNIFLLRDDRSRLIGVKVLDFGISKVAGDPLDNKLTQSGTILGTPAYMAPEQLTAGAVDARTDVYALGAIVYEAIAGVLPHPGGTFALMATAKLGRDPTPLRKQAPGTSRALSKVVDRALARNPNARFQNVAAFAEALEEFTDVGFGGAAVELASETGRLAAAAPKDRNKTWVAVAVAGALVALITGGVGAWVLGSDGPDDQGNAYPIANEGEPAADGTQVVDADPVDEAAEPGIPGPGDPRAINDAGVDSGSEETAAGATEEPTVIQEAQPAEPPLGDDTSGSADRPSMRRGMRRSMGRSGSLGTSDFL